MKLLRRLLAGTILTLAAVLLAASFEVITLSSEIFRMLDSLFLALWPVLLVVDWRFQKRHPVDEPSPAKSAAGVIVGTGGFAVVMTVRGVHSTTGYVVPTIIAVATILLAFIAYRFASKNRDAIGEARFKTIPEDT